MAAIRQLTTRRNQKKKKKKKGKDQIEGSVLSLSVSTAVSADAATDRSPPPGFDRRSFQRRTSSPRLPDHGCSRRSAYLAVFHRQSRSTSHGFSRLVRPAPADVLVDRGKGLARLTELFNPVHFVFTLDGVLFADRFLHRFGF